MFIPINSEDAAGPKRGFAWVTAAIIVANIIVFTAGQDQGRGGITWTHCLVPREVVDFADVVMDPMGSIVELTPAVKGSSGEILFPEKTEVIGSFAPGTLPPLGRSPSASTTLLSYMFMHAGWLHLVFNMIFLWAFGAGLEKLLGSVRYLFFYGVAGALAGLVSAWSAWAIHGLGSVEAVSPHVGASGAIAGVMGGFLVLLPNRRITILVVVPPRGIFMKSPAWVFIGIWGLAQILQAFGVLGGATGVDLAAHIGGLAAGMIFVAPT